MCADRQDRTREDPKSKSPSMNMALITRPMIERKIEMVSSDAQSDAPSAPVTEAEQAGLAVCTTDCYECSTPLHGPYCPACNPEMANAGELLKAAVRVRARAQAMRLDPDAAAALGDLSAAISKARGKLAATPAGEDTCQDCGGHNPVWFAPSLDWNFVMGGPEAKGDPGGFICPNCYIKRAGAVLDHRAAWVVSRVVDAPLWFDIATAPRDGKHILLAATHGDFPLVGAWCPYRHAFVCSRDDSPFYPAPTHWMLLPDAPSRPDADTADRQPSPREAIDQ